MMRFLQEPRWADWGCLKHTRVPPGLSSWLLERGSLTARLKSASAGEFRVNLLSQSWRRPLYSEQRLLEMKPGQVALVREVQLICRGRPWVFARTLIPLCSMRGAARRLSLLGERPLGEVLFSAPDMRRGITQVARLDGRHQLYVKADGSAGGCPSIWGRRSLFYLSSQPLLVNEIFLPDLLLSSR